MTMSKSVSMDHVAQDRRVVLRTSGPRVELAHGRRGAVLSERVWTFADADRATDEWRRRVRRLLRRGYAGVDEQGRSLHEVFGVVAAVRADLEVDLPDDQESLDAEEWAAREVAVAAFERFRGKEEALRDPRARRRLGDAEFVGAMLAVVAADGPLAQRAFEGLERQVAVHGTVRVAAAVCLPPGPALERIEADFAGPYAAIATPLVAMRALDDLETDPPAAMAWIGRHPEYAARAWIPVALGDGLRRGAAARALGRMVRGGWAEVVRRVATDYGPTASKLLDR